MPFPGFPFINNSVQLFILTSLPLHCLSPFLKLFCRTEIVKVSSPLSSNTLTISQHTLLPFIPSFLLREIQNEESILDSHLFHFIIRHGRILVHTACHRRYVTFFFFSFPPRRQRRPFKSWQPDRERDKSHSGINIQTLGIGCGALCKHGQLSSCDQDGFLAVNKLEHTKEPRLVRVNSESGIVRL